MGHITKKAIVLVAITILCFTITPFAAKGQVSTVSSINNDALKRQLDECYIQLLQLNSNVTLINSSVDLQKNDVIVGYTYTGTFSCGSLFYCVNASQLQTTVGNTETTATMQNISGSSTSHFSSNEVATTVGNTLTKYMNFDFITSNLSGTYYLNMQANTLAALDKSALLSGNAQMDENISLPSGTYTTTFEPKQNNNVTTALVTLPSGSQATFNMASSLPNGTSRSISIENDILPLDDSPPPYGCSLFDPPLNYQNNYLLMGGYIWWNSGYDILGTIITALIGIIVATAAVVITGGTLGAGIGIVGLVIAAVTVVYVQHAPFLADNEGLPIYVMYVDFEFQLLFGLIPIPCYYETGFYTDQYILAPFNSGYPVYIPWTYFPLSTLYNPEIDPWSSISNHSHTSLWPIEPLHPSCSVIFNSLDESANSGNNRILNVAFMIDGNVVPETICYSQGVSPSIVMPEGMHTVGVPFFGGALDYLNVNGNIYYSNVVNVTISGLTTINAYYKHSITIQLGFCSSLNSQVPYMIQNFLYSANPTYPNDLYQHAITSVISQSDSDHNVFVGVKNGAYSAGLVDRPPTEEEWNMLGMENLQLWAVGYGGDPNANFTASGLIWMVTSQCLSRFCPDVAEGIFINWVRLTAMKSQDCFHSPIDMAGQLTVNSDLSTHTPLPGQTQTIPDGKVNFRDLSYFVQGYIAYYGFPYHYNPNCDMNADGKINFSDLTKFVQAYIQWFSII